MTIYLAIMAADSGETILGVHDSIDSASKQLAEFEESPTQVLFIRAWAINGDPVLCPCGEDKLSGEFFSLPGTWTPACQECLDMVVRLLDQD